VTAAPAEVTVRARIRVPLRRTLIWATHCSARADFVTLTGVTGSLPITDEQSEQQHCATCHNDLVSEGRVACCGCRTDCARPPTAAELLRGPDSAPQEHVDESVANPLKLCRSLYDEATQGDCVVARCANPACNRLFEDLSKGRLFLLPLTQIPSPDSTSNGDRLIDLGYWLCPECAATYSIARTGTDVVIAERGPGTACVLSVAPRRRPRPRKVAPRNHRQTV
jgi:hypothetical protein